MLGTLSWQGVTMDPIMMAALIISVGFSVDIPAHVSYHYHSAGRLFEWIFDGCFLKSEYSFYEG